MPKSAGGLLKVVTIILAFLALCAVLAIGGLVYVGYRVKHKVEEVAGSAKQAKEQLAPLLPGKSATARECPVVDPAQSRAFRTAAAAASIPLIPGLTLVEIWTNPEKQAHDVEILETVEAVDDNTVRMGMSSTKTEQQKFRQNSSRILCIADLINGRQYETAFGAESEQVGSVPQTIVGATMFSLSQAVFRDLKASRPAELEYYVARQSLWSLTEYRLTDDFKVQLRRAEPEDVPYPVIVNGERRPLPAIHIKDSEGKRIDAHILDEPANPIALNFATPDQKFHITYVKINFPVKKKIEQELTHGRCAAVYGIYFDFDSAGLRAESGPALQEIADALQHNSAWNLTIEGHTDNIGGDAYNMELSSRRAEAVKQALVGRYSIPAGRLSSAGFGMSRPKASNDTVEGRALNRRVELCRQ